MPVKLTIPGSKSIANRALALNFLTGNKTKIKNIPECDDTKYMIDGLKKLKFKSPKVKIYTGNAGTATRFLTAIATLTEKTVVIDGDRRMRERPIEELTKALNTLGAKIETTKGHLPITINPSKLIGGKIKLPGNISSQYLSAILMATAFAEKPSTISIEQKLYSKPYIDITIKVMESFGIKIANKNFSQFTVTPKNPRAVPKIYTIESDASSASYPGAHAALRPSTSVILTKLNNKSIQGDIKFLQYLKKMGCKITSHQKENTLIIGPKQLKALGTIDMNSTPDLVMTFAILAAFAKGKTTIKNIANLRIKESDRIEALENELKKIGTQVKTGPDWIEIQGPTPASAKKISIKTYNDHRIAMSFAILQGIFPNFTIQNPNCVSKSYTTFWGDLKKLNKS